MQKDYFLSKKKCKRNIKFGIEEDKFYWENTKMEYSHLIYKIYNNGGLTINFANFSLSHPSHIFSTTVISLFFFFFCLFFFSSLFLILLLLYFLILFVIFLLIIPHLTATIPPTFLLSFWTLFLSIFFSINL
jgi:hypothetical protein